MASATVEQHVVAGPVAMGVVEQPEVVDVDERDADAATRRRGRASISVARCSTSAPWFSVSVNASSRVASTSASVWRLIVWCADRKTR